MSRGTSVTKRYPIKLMQLGDIWKWGRESLMVVKKEHRDAWHVTFLRLDTSTIDTNEYSTNTVYVDKNTFLIRDGKAFDFDTIPDTIPE